MRLVIFVCLLLVIGGCKTEPSRDPYLAALDQYVASLDAAQQAGSQVDPPPQPAYLECPVQPEPLPGSPETERGFSGDTIRRTTSLTKLSTRSQAQCKGINTARRRAYERAMQKYLHVVSNRSSRTIGITSR